MKRRRTVLVLGAAVGVLALGSTMLLRSPTAGNSDALVAHSGFDSLCSPSVRNSSGTTTSIEGVQNRSDKPVTVTSVELLHPVGLRVLAISVLNQNKTTPFSGFGQWYGYPPRRLPEAWRAEWERLETPESAVIPPQHGPDEYAGFVIGIAGVRGSAGPLQIRYQDGDGRPGSVVIPTRILTSPHCHGPFPGYRGFGKQ